MRVANSPTQNNSPTTISRLAKCDSNTVSMANLPTLDFSKFYTGSEREKMKLGRDLVQSFSDHGFVKLINYSIKDEDISTALDWVKYLLLSPHRNVLIFFELIISSPKGSFDSPQM
jgi:hypothetical protein